MKIATQNLFSSPVWTFDMEDAERLNTMLYMDGINFTKASESSKVNFFEFPGYGIEELKNNTLTAIQTMADEYSWPAYTPVIKARQNVIQPLECDSPHHHADADLVAVYYVVCPEKSGDILIQDPRGSIKTIWEDPCVNNQVDGRKSRVFCRVTPRPGLLIIFPNYLFHSVETNLSNENRISIVLNIRLDMEAVGECS